MTSHILARIIVFVTNQFKRTHDTITEINSVSTCIILLDWPSRTDTRDPLRPATAVSCQGVREIRLRALSDTFIEDQNSHLFGLSGPQPLNSSTRDTEWTRSKWSSPQSSRLWAKSRQTALRTEAPSEHSFQKEVRTSEEEREPWGLEESSRQA